MATFELLLALLLGATLLSLLAQYVGVPYPALLAVGGAAIALIPGLPTIAIPPDLILALFVAPVLLDAAYDSSQRDLKRNWRPIIALVMVAVLLTTIVVAVVSHYLLPAMPWAAAIALGALVAPPDAVAAIAVLRHVHPPHRIRTILEGESLLNDASSLLIYRAAVGTMTVGGFNLAQNVPYFPFIVLGSVALGWALAYPIGFLIGYVKETAAAAVLQFITAFFVWILAERLGLSAVLATVTFGLIAARRGAFSFAANLRVGTFAVWETATFILNVLAFTMIGLQLRPILAALDTADLKRYLLVTVAILTAVIVVRFLWAGLMWIMQRLGTEEKQFSSAEAAVIGWSGMRGIVTLAAAMALPSDFPFRDFIQFTAFVVVVGTLLIQGLTLGFLVKWCGFPPDDVVSDEIARARAAALKAAIGSLEGQRGDVAERLRQEYQESVSAAKWGGDPFATKQFTLRRRSIDAARQELSRLRQTEAIGDDAYHIVEEELDWTDLSAGVEKS